MTIHLHFLLNHLVDSVFKRLLASNLVSHRHQVILSAQDVQNVVVVLQWVLWEDALIPKLRDIVDLLLGDGNGIIDFETADADMLLNIMTFIDFIKNLPSHIPVDFLLLLLVLISAHHALRPLVICFLGGLKFGVKVFIHLCSHVLVLLDDAVVLITFSTLQCCATQTSTSKDGPWQVRVLLNHSWCPESAWLLRSSLLVDARVPLVMLELWLLDLVTVSLNVLVEFELVLDHCI